MKNSKILTVFVMVAMGLCLSFSSIANEDQENKAVKAATAWLALIDKHKYGESWETAAIYFKNSVSKNQWKQMLTAVREPLGRLVSRELKSKNYMKSLPGAPDGEYVVIQFTTSFDNKKSGIETVTPMMEADGNWKVSGYFIQ